MNATVKESGRTAGFLAICLVVFVACGGGGGGGADDAKVTPADIPDVKDAEVKDPGPPDVPEVKDQAPVPDDGTAIDPGEAGPEAFDAPDQAGDPGVDPGDEDVTVEDEGPADDGPPPPPPKVVINEILVDTEGTDQDVWVELWGPPLADLSGWKLVGVNGKDGKDYQVIPLDGRALNPDGSFLIVSSKASQDLKDMADMVSDQADYENGPDSLHLRLYGEVMDSVAYGQFSLNEFPDGEGDPAEKAPAGQSIGRYPNAMDTDDNSTDFKVFLDPTPGESNGEPLVPEEGEDAVEEGADEEVAAGEEVPEADVPDSWDVEDVVEEEQVTPPPKVVMNEVMFNAKGSDLDVWIELFGPAGTDLTGWKVVGVNGSDGKDYQPILLDGKSIPEDGFFLIVSTKAVTQALIDAADLQSANVDYQNGPDSIQLRMGAEVMDAVAYGDFSTGAIAAGEGDPVPKTLEGQSIGRQPDGDDTGDNLTDFAVFDAPTPGATNGEPLSHCTQAGACAAFDLCLAGAVDECNAAGPPSKDFCWEMSNMQECSGLDPEVRAAAIELCGAALTDCADADGDGKYADYDDCDDSNPNVFPANANTFCDCDATDGSAKGTGKPEAPDACDGKDNNCDGKTDEGCAQVTCGQALTKSATLDTDLSCAIDAGKAAITVSGAGIVLDCGGFKVTNGDAGTGMGILVTGDQVTVKDCHVEGFDHGIYLYGSSLSTVKDCSADDNSLHGIRIHTASADNPASGNTLTGNSATFNMKNGIYVSGAGSTGNVLAQNVACDNGAEDILVEAGASATGTGNTCVTAKDFKDDGAAAGCTVGCM